MITVLTPASGWRGVAPAKVNLRLQVLGPGEDGFHPVETVLQALELVDDVELSPSPDDGIALQLSGVEPGALGPDADNLVVRAATAFRSAVAVRGDRGVGVTIRLHKRIPHGGGLGGGSSDAATVLRGMNELFGTPLPAGDLLRLAAALGSDVPFFVLDRSRALAWGRGEKTLSLPPLPSKAVLVAVPAEPISTSWAYRQLDAFRDSRTSGEMEVLPGGEAATGPSATDLPWAVVAARARNDFEDALFPLRPGLGRIKKALQDAGARPALLSGSGSALFGVFEDDESAERAESALVLEAGDLRTFRTRTRA